VRRPTTLPALPLDAASNPTRVHTVRRQLDEMDRIRAFVLTLPMHDRKRWVAALEPLTTALHADLSVHEGTGSLGALLAAGYGADATDVLP
jgi:hypothetical protein